MRIGQFGDIYLNQSWQGLLMIGFGVSGKEKSQV